MMALPIVTLMILLSSTFVRLPGTVATDAGDIVFPRTNLSQLEAVSRHEAPAFGHTPNISEPGCYTRRGTLSSRDIPWTALNFELLNGWNGNLYSIDTLRINVSGDSKADHPVVRDLEVVKGLNSAPPALHERLMRSKRVARR